MALTRPIGEQLRLQSSKTGEHVLDTYLEAAEVGGRTLADLLEDVFDPNASGKLRTDLYQFRINAGQLEHRVGDYADQTSGWTAISSFFKDRGAFAAGTTYNRLDVILHADIYYFETSATPVSYASAAAFLASPTVRAFVNVATIKTYRDDAIAARDTALTHKDAAAASASSASTSASTATTKASEASTSASTATTKASEASTSAATATTKAAEASTSAAEAADVALAFSIALS